MMGAFTAYVVSHLHERTGLFVCMFFSLSLHPLICSSISPHLDYVFSLLHFLYPGFPMLIGLWLYH